MSQKVNIDGKEVELFTKEEMDAKEKEVKEAETKIGQEASVKAGEEAVEKYKSENPDKTTELTKAQEDLVEANKKLEEAEGGTGGGEGDSEQVKRLRKDREEAQAKHTEEIQKVQEQLKVITDTVVGNVKEDLLVKFSGGDEEVRKKIELKYDSFVGDAVTKEITTRMMEAVTLVTGAAPAPGILDAAMGAGARGETAEGGEVKKHVVTENEKAIGKVLGISEEDRVKYGPEGEKAPKTTEKEE